MAVPPPPTETVTVLASSYVFPVANAAVTVTVVAPSPSPTLDGLAERFTAGAPSSSVSVRAEAALTVRSAAVPAMPTVSLPSTTLSSVGVSVNVAVPLVPPAAIVTATSETSA